MDPSTGWLLLSISCSRHNKVENNKFSFVSLSCEQPFLHSCVNYAHVMLFIWHLYCILLKVVVKVRPV